MAAYVVVEVEVTDAAKYEAYKPLAQAAVAKYGGRYLARGGTTAVLEGDWKPARLVIFEFPSLDQARNFYTSVEYTAARRARAGAARMDIVAIEGV
ncbi:MAG: DUF1330 domain-containing protein [Pseudomonadota bacterium]